MEIRIAKTACLTRRAVVAGAGAQDPDARRCLVLIQGKKQPLIAAVDLDVLFRVFCSQSALAIR
jgi:hypothetical protein